MTFLDHRLTSFEATFKQNIEKENNYVKTSNQSQHLWPMG
jgi:hypothetical protein